MVNSAPNATVAVVTAVWHLCLNEVSSVRAHSSHFLYASLYSPEFSGSRWQMKGEPRRIHTISVNRDASKGWKGKVNNARVVDCARGAAGVEDNSESKTSW